MWNGTFEMIMRKKEFKRKNLWKRRRPCNRILGIVKLLLK